jgi:hypothetical protein
LRNRRALDDKGRPSCDRAEQLVQAVVEAKRSRLAMRSSGRTPIYETTAAVPAQRFACESVTPFGSPVEPDV